MMIDQTYEPADASTLSDKQQRVLAGLLTYATVRECAKQTQVSEATVYRYKNDPVFSDALRSMQAQRMQSAVGYLQAGTGDALGALREIMTDREQAGTVRVAACRAWIGYALRTYYDLSEVDQLIERLRTEVDDLD
jgi:hypothetical protein